NQPPSFSLPLNTATTRADAVYSNSAQITNISAGGSFGAVNESTQTLHFNVLTNSNPNIFSTAPAFAVNGTNGSLSFTPTPNNSGQVVVTFNLQDNGGTANGGQDTSAPQTLTINVNPAPPVLPATLSASDMVNTKLTFPILAQGLAPVTY